MPPRADIVGSVGRVTVDRDEVGSGPGAAEASQVGEDPVVEHLERFEGMGEGLISGVARDRLLELADVVGLVPVGPQLVEVHAGDAERFRAGPVEADLSYELVFGEPLDGALG